MSNKDITAIILAGGQGKRMGGKDKGLIPLLQKPMIEYVLDAITPQVGKVIINTNSPPDRYTQYALTIVADQQQGYCGPLAGMASGLQISKTPYVITVPCDSPLIPDDFVQKLYMTLQNEDAEIATVCCNGRLQPVFALISSALLPSILDCLAHGEYKIDRWFAKHRLAIHDFSVQAERFININSAVELQKIEQRIQTS